MVHPTRATCLAAFNDMFKTIHVDEKLFYTEVRRRYYLLPGKAVPHRHVRSKRYITKVMMLAAVARPRWDPESGTYFDGKLSISPFVERKPAVPSSQRRPAETTLHVPLRCQPPNSPDLNCLGLSLFSAIQARQQLLSPKKIDELLDAVTDSSWA
ncbi:hypothetical protein F442_20003 [Phytophthora nicotianae P10297]|uniref:Uncharacterized protein n=1 Tax=Phytophthora nicotianae P10297 TaxID=1317064 RepID=W2Y7M7_PHYNI|nr:hypothetical protein F442_20003 [Phytophthora nicotianae P10297]